MNPLSWSAETWLSLCEWAGLVAAFASVVFLFGALKAGKVVNDRQGEKILTLETGLAEAKTKQAEAEQGLERLRKRQEPRVTATAALVEALKDKPTGVAEILYEEGDGEVYVFAGWLKSTLVYSKWQVTEPRPIGETVSGSYSGISREELRKMPPPMRLGASPVGVSVIMNAKTQDTMMRSNKPTPFKAILQAFAAANLRLSGGQDDVSLPDDFLRIVVAPR